MRFLSFSALLGLAAAAAALCACARQPIDSAMAQSTSGPIACAEADPASGSIATVVAAARAFERTLTEAQRQTLNHPLELKYAIRWSNYPSALIPRYGVAFGDMSPAQAEAAEALVLAAAGACGERLFDQNRQADIVGHTALPWVGPGFHYVSFNGAPSETQPWMLMISGHHLDFNFVFNGPDPGATPLFAGSDPGRFVNEQGVTLEPMAPQGRILSALARAVAVEPDATLPGVYTDLVHSVTGFGPPPGTADGRAARPAGAGAPPGGFGGGPFGGGGADRMASTRGTDESYPAPYPEGATGRGVAYAKLPPETQLLVRRAIESYAGLAGRGISEPLLRLYETPEALAQTYVGISGDPNLVLPHGYVRIDGPRVWIELSVQESLIDPSTTHFHSLWRDKVADYGGQFRG